MTLRNMFRCFSPSFYPSEPDYHLEHILRFLAESLLMLVGSVPHGTLKVGEQRPHCFVTVLDVAPQRERSIQQQKTLGQICVLVHRLLARWESRHHKKKDTIKALNATSFRYKK